MATAHTTIQDTPTIILGSIPNIEPKLDGASNYSSWNFVMKVSLRGLDLWECINNSDINILEPGKDQKTIICLNVKSHCQIHFKNVTTAKEVWTKLSLAYEDKDLPRILNLMRALLRINLSKFNNANEYISEALSLNFARIKRHWKSIR